MSEEITAAKSTKPEAALLILQTMRKKDADMAVMPVF